MDWQSKYIRDYEIYLRLEKSLSENSQKAYLSDLNKFFEYLSINQPGMTPPDCSIDELRDFTKWISDSGLGAISQARIISGLRSFYKYIRMEGIIDSNPAKLLEAPKTGRKLPDVLSVEEIELIISSIDLSSKQGYRDKTIIEVLYSCGLRVSEISSLLISNINFKYQYLQVIGKGNKERLIPLGSHALKAINYYSSHYRSGIRISSGYEDHLFLNRFGKSLSRVTIFNIVKSCVEKAGIKKTVSPHTFRHSFATHLVEGGADLRAVQQLLGHESILTTEIYTHLNSEFLTDTIRRFHPRSNSQII